MRSLSNAEIWGDENRNGATPTSRFVEIGVMPGRSSFEVEELKKRQRGDAPEKDRIPKRVPREDGWHWTQSEAEKDAEESGAYYGEKWMDEARLRREILEKDRDYAFLVLVAGAANATVEQLLDVPSTDSRVRALIRVLREERRRAPSPPPNLEPQEEEVCVKKEKKKKKEEMNASSRRRAIARAYVDSPAVSEETMASVRPELEEEARFLGLESGDVGRTLMGITSATVSEWMKRERPELYERYARASASHRPDDATAIKRRYLMEVAREADGPSSIAVGANAGAALHPPPYRPRRAWLELPEHSGVVRMKPDVVAAINNAHGFVRQFVSRDDRLERDPEVLQRDPQLRGDFATLVTLKMFSAGYLFPKAYTRRDQLRYMKVQEMNVVNRLKRTLADDDRCPF